MLNQAFAFIQAKKAVKAQWKLLAFAYPKSGIGFAYIEGYWINKLKRWVLKRDGIGVEIMRQISGRLLQRQRFNLIVLNLKNHFQINAHREIDWAFFYI